MYLIISKRPRLDITFNKQISNSNKNLIALSLYNNFIFFFSSLTIAWSLLIQYIDFLVDYYHACNQIFCLNSSIGIQILLSVN